jgi:hypothetical protein
MVNKIAFVGELTLLVNGLYKVYKKKGLFGEPIKIWINQLKFECKGVA